MSGRWEVEEDGRGGGKEELYYYEHNGLSFHFLTSQAPLTANMDTYSASSARENERERTKVFHSIPLL